MLRLPSSIEKKIFAGFGFAFVLSVFISLATYWNHQRLLETRRKVVATEEILRSLKQILSTLTDAETGTRGFVLTGDEAFLAPFQSAVERVGPDLQASGRRSRTTAVRSRQAWRIWMKLARKRLQFLARANDLRRTSGFDAARELAGLSEGRAQMDAIRDLISGGVERDRVDRAQAKMKVQRRGARGRTF